MNIFPDSRREQYLEKPLPSNEESERVILGAVLLDNSVIAQAVEHLRPEDFYSPLNRRVFAAMIALFEKQKQIDPILIGEELKKEGSLESIGGISTITNLTFGLPHFSNVEEYIAIVKEKSGLRQLIRTCGIILNDALSQDTSAASIFADAQTKINELCLAAESGNANEYFTRLDNVISSDIGQILDDLRHGRSSKIKTGFAGIDHALGGGIVLSDIVLLASDTGKGKSSLALQLAFGLASQDIPTAFLAGEMTNKENVLRLLSQRSGITNLNWKTYISQVEYENLVAWAEAIKNAPIYFEHRISDMHTLGTHLRSLVRREKVKVLVIDYVQLFKMEKMDKRKRTERIAEVSQEVKRLANELEIGIIEVAQFNREGGKSAKPGLHDLEGSGQLEKDASIIFILEVEDMELSAEDGRRYNDAKIRIVKGRNIGKSEVRGRFYGSAVRFVFD